MALIKSELTLRAQGMIGALLTDSTNSVRIRFLMRQNGLNKVRIHFTSFGKVLFEPNEVVGVAIYEKGEEEFEDWNTAGEHYNPYNARHHGHYNEVRYRSHLGDIIGNIQARPDGSLDYQKDIRTKEKILQFVNRAIFIHMSWDDMGAMGLCFGAVYNQTEKIIAGDNPAYERYSTMETLDLANLCNKLEYFDSDIVYGTPRWKLENKLCIQSHKDGNMGKKKFGGIIIDCSINGNTFEQKE